MKTKATEYKLFTIAIGALILILIFLSSCQKSELPPHVNRHNLIFERGNDSTYLYSDHHQDSVYSYEDHKLDRPFAGRVVKNGYRFESGLQYSFEIKDDTVFVKAEHTVDVAKWRDKGTGKNGTEIVPVIEGNFKHKFGNNEYTDGYFTIEVPYKD